jgi:hypothetical protein
MHFYLRLDPADLPALGRWRQESGWQACHVAGELWVRGPLAARRAEVAQLPCLEHYLGDEHGLLVPEGKRLPTRTAPRGIWLSLTEFLAVERPAAVPSFKPVPPIAWALQSSATERAPTALITDLATLESWLEHTLALRLAPLCFALADDGSVLLLGTPLPALPGQTYYPAGPLLVPAGWEIPSHVWPAWVAQGLGLAVGDWALLSTNRPPEKISAAGMVPLTRANLRFSVQARQVLEILD